MPGLVPGIHVLAAPEQERRGWPGHLARRRASRFRPAMTGSELISTSPIQRLVPPKNPLLVERDPPVARQIRLDVRARRNAVAQFDETGNFALERLHAFRKGVAQSLPDPPHRHAPLPQAPPAPL